MKFIELMPGKSTLALGEEKAEPDSRIAAFQLKQLRFFFFPEKKEEYMQRELTPDLGDTEKHLANVAVALVEPPHTATVSLRKL